MNRINNTLFAAFKVWLYLLIVVGIIGLLAIFVIIPRWVRTEEVLVPNVIGEDYYEAVLILDEVGLRPAKTVHEASSDAPKGKIVAQNPQENFRIKSHQPVEITVSIGVELAPVPSVIGKSRDAALDALTVAGFRPNRVAFCPFRKITYQITVIAQNPTRRWGVNAAAPLLVLFSEPWADTTSYSTPEFSRANLLMP